jgi:hypothetical protein
MSGPGSPATIASLAIRWRSSVLVVKSSDRSEWFSLQVLGLG